MTSKKHKDPFAGLYISAGLTADEPDVDVAEVTAGNPVPITYVAYDINTNEHHIIADPDLIAKIKEGWEL